MDDVSPIRVRVAYGTSRRISSIAGTEFLIGPDQPAAYALSGLSRPTKFSMKAIVVLDYTELWFDRAPDVPVRATPQMGILHPSLMPVLKAALRAAGII